jgi:hypothetical protein
VGGGGSTIIMRFPAFQCGLQITKNKSVNKIASTECCRGAVAIFKLVEPAELQHDAITVHAPSGLQNGHIEIIYLEKGRGFPPKIIVSKFRPEFRSK